MDSLTHIVIGACIGEAMLGRQLGKKALLWGALAHSFPDVDIVSSLWLPMTQDLIAHRGITHSLLFAFLAGILLSLVASRLHRPHDIPLRSFLLFFWVAIGLHDLLDTCNSYGTGLLEPFNDRRFSFNLLFVADPLFSIWPLVAAVALFIMGRYHRFRKRWMIIGLAPAVVYIGVAGFNKSNIERHIEKSLAAQKIRYTDYFTTPTPLNNLLWYTVAQTDSGYFIGHRSVFDRNDQITAFQYFPRNEHLLDPVENKQSVKDLKQFALDYYTVEEWNDTLVFNVLRFGQVLGWQHPRNRFIFHYYLNPTYNNDLVVQRGRFMGWNKLSMRIMLQRIQGSIEQQIEK